MRFNDIHVHYPDNKRHGNISSLKLLKQMDKMGLEHMAVISWYGHDLDEQKDNIINTGKFIRQAPERLYGLAWIEPRHHTPFNLLDRVIHEQKFRGFKMIPNRWYPYEERILKYCERMSALNAPCLLHSGILYFETFSSRFCRPVYYEALLQVPRFRFALAHISWPWTDECLALFGSARSLRQSGQSTAEMFIDISPGTPSDYRIDALRHLVNFGAEDFLIYGSDVFLPGGISQAADQIKKDLFLFRKLKLSNDSIGKICRRNFKRFFAVKR
jgi:predicted TIM-barrel fold metal-dependent hydrolase